MADSRYEHLTWRRRRPTRLAVSVPRSTLLLGSDHILKVESTIFSEDYKRFFFRDIQSITIRTNRRLQLWNVVLVGLLALTLAEGFFDTSTWNAWAITMMIMASITAMLLVVNNVFGTSCDVLIQTAVQNDILTPLSRVKRANKALERLRPLIIQAQGQLPAEELALRLRDLAASKSGTVTPPPAQPNIEHA
jgi:hypothetical protein